MDRVGLFEHSVPFPYHLMADHDFPYVQWSKDAMKGFNYDPPSLLKTCDLLCVAIGGLV